MNSLNEQLARTLMQDRQRDFEVQRVRREARLTRPAVKHPAPGVRRQPGLLARLVPWFGVRSHAA